MVDTSQDQKTSISPMPSVRNGAKASSSTRRRFHPMRRKPRRLGTPVWSWRIVAQSRTRVERWSSSYPWGNLNSGSRMSLHSIRRKPRRMGTPLSGAQEFQPSLFGQFNDKEKEYGWRVGRIVDPFGHHWEIGKPLADA